MILNSSDSSANLPEPAEDPGLQSLIEEIIQKHGDALMAILVYGSWLRGKRDTMLDFYVLVDGYHTLDSTWQGWMCQLLPPNVYHIHQGKDGGKDRGKDGLETGQPGMRAKYALMTLSRFHKGMREDFHSYFWARFAQPCEILYARDETTRSVLTDALHEASTTFVQRVLPTMGDHFSSADLWTRGLALTYRCELRTESSDRGESIYAFDPAYYDALTTAFAQTNKSLSHAEGGDGYHNHSGALSRKLSPLSWWLRRMQGKMLSMLRLVKAAFTFNEPLQYLLWKIERHSGLYIQPTPRQLAHPLIFAWPLLWKLYRQGAFR